MSDARDIAQHGTELCAAALAFALPAAAGVAPLAIPAATLTAIGYTLWRGCGRRACDRAAEAALRSLQDDREHRPEDLARAKALLKDARRPVDLAPAELRAAATSDDFDGALAARLTDALTEPGDHALRAILGPVFRAGVATCRRDEGFHRDLTLELLLDAARSHDVQLQLLHRIDRKIDDVAGKLDAIAHQSRDTLEAIALRFGVTEPEDMALGDLRGFLIEKARDYRRVLVQVKALEDREGRIANLKAAAEDAVRDLRLDEAKQLIRDAVSVQRSERTLAALRDDAALVETEAEIALLEGDAAEAHRLLAAAADSFVPFDRMEAVNRRRDYLQKLYWHGLRYGGTSIAAAIDLGRANLADLDETADA